MKLPCLAIVVSFASVASAQFIPEHLSVERSEPVGIGLGNRMYFAGGGLGTGADYSDVVDVYDVGTGEWYVEHLSQGRYRLAAGRVGSKVFFGGGVGPTATDAVDVLDTSTGTWTLHHLSQARGALAAASLPTKVLFAGGANGPASDVVDVYDEVTGSWTVAHLSQARWSLAGVAAGGKAFFAGGVGGSGGMSDVVDIYDESTGSWSTATLSEPRSSLAATAVGNKVLFAGGDSGSGTESAAVDIYDLSTGAWTAATLSQGRKRLAAATAGARAFFAGGFSSGASDRVDVYDAATGAWLQGSLTAGRYWLAGASAAGRVVFAGGNDGTLFDLADVFVGGEDCDGDLIADWDAVLAGIAADCNGNGIPDPCDVGLWAVSSDCNGNGVPDECDPDADGDSIPDDCVQVTAVSQVLASGTDDMVISGKAFEPSSAVTVDGVGVPVVTQSAIELRVTATPAVPGIFDVAVTNSVSSAIALDAGHLLPSLSASTTGIGGSVDVTLDNGDAGLYALAFATGVFPAPFPIASPPTWYGVLLDITGPVFTASSGAFATPDPVLLSFPVPDNPAFAGLTLHFQGWCQQGLFGEVTASFTNAAAVTL